MRNTAALIASLTLLLAAGTSSANGWYGNVLTSDLAGDVRIELHADIDFNPFNVTAFDFDLTPNAGLGSPEIPPTKTFSFSVDPLLGQIEQAWLYIGLADDHHPFHDPLDLMGTLFEVAVIEFGSTTWTDEVGGVDWALAPVFGDVTAELLINQTNFVVNVGTDANVGGDFLIVSAALKVKFSDAVGVVPEPNAALLFGLGALVVSATRRR